MQSNTLIIYQFNYLHWPLLSFNQPEWSKTISTKR